MSSAFKVLSTALLVSISAANAMSDGVPSMIEQPQIPVGWGTITEVAKPKVSLGGWGTIAPSVKKPAETNRGWGTIAPSVNKKPTVSLGSWGAPAAVNLEADERAYKHATHDIYEIASEKAVPLHATVLGADEKAYKHATQGVFEIATHEAVDSTQLAALKTSHANLTATNFSLAGAVAFAEVIKASHNHISAYLNNAGKTLLGSLAAGERAPWSEDATEAMITALNIAAITETLADATTPISSLNQAAALAILEGGDLDNKTALIAGLKAEAARLDATRSDNSGTIALATLLSNIQIREFLKRVA